MAPLSLCTPSSHVRFGDTRSGVTVCDGSAAAWCGPSLVRIDVCTPPACLHSAVDESLAAASASKLRGSAQLSSRRLPLATCGLSSRGARLVLPAFSLAAVYARPGSDARVLFCTLVLRRGVEAAGYPATRWVLMVSSASTARCPANPYDSISNRNAACPAQRAERALGPRCAGRRSTPRAERPSFKMSDDGPFRPKQPANQLRGLTNA